VNWYLAVLKNYKGFSGRARRREVTTVRRKVATRILYASLGVVIPVAAAGCAGSAASPSSAFISTTVPRTQAGTQLTWFLDAMANIPLSRQMIEAHFDSRFLGKISPEEINSDLAGVPAPSGASLIGLLSQGPASLMAVAAFGDVKLTVSISVDGAGLISGILLTPYRPPPASWAQADQELAALAPDTSLLAARVSPSGTCTPVHQVASSTARPLGSMFKLFVLGALAHQIASGRVSWHHELTVTDALKSAAGIPGSLQDDPAGTRVSVQQTATKMISISDNTAADMLIHLVGRPAVESQVRQWSDHAALDVPFLTTREAFLLKDAGYPALADKYLSLGPGRRAAFLASSVDPLPLSRLTPGGWTQPRNIDTIEWFASPDDICRAFAGLHQLATQPRLAPVGSVLSVNSGDIGLGKPQWPTVWFKGGSEPGVLTLGYLATNSKGQTFVVVAMLGNPAAALPPSATIALLAIAHGAFELIR
jgi:hypothetical protein